MKAPSVLALLLLMLPLGISCDVFDHELTVGIEGLKDGGTYYGPQRIQVPISDPENVWQVELSIRTPDFAIAGLWMDDQYPFIFESLPSDSIFFGPDVIVTAHAYQGPPGTTSRIKDSKPIRVRFLRPDQ